MNTSLAKTDILSGASKSPSVTAFTAKRDCPSDSDTQRYKTNGELRTSSLITVITP